MNPAHNDNEKEAPRDGKREDDERQVYPPKPEAQGDFHGEEQLATAQSGDEATLKCFTCGNEINAGGFFQILNDSGPIVFCSQNCVVRYRETLHRAKDAR